MTAPGWYRDPADPTTQRYWDGEGWVGGSLPAEATPPAGPLPDQPPPPPPATPPRPTPSRATPEATPPRTTPLRPTSEPGLPQAPGPGTPVPGPGTPDVAGPAVPGAPPRPHGLALASYDARLIARIIDIAVVFLLAAVVNAWFIYQWVLEYHPMVERLLADRTMPRPTARMEYLEITALIVTTALWLAYEVPALGSSGQTLGKRVMNIKVVPMEGTDPLGAGRAFRRWSRLGMWTPLWALSCIAVIPQLITAASPLWDRTLRQAWHDKLAGTLVVQLPPRHAARGPAGRPAAPSNADNGSAPDSVDPGGSR